MRLCVPDDSEKPIELRCEGDRHLASGIDWSDPQALNRDRSKGVTFPKLPKRNRDLLDFHDRPHHADIRAHGCGRPRRRVGCSAVIGGTGTAKINVTAIDAVSVDGRYGAIFWVAPKDVKKIAALLGAAGAAIAGTARQDSANGQ